MVGISEPELAEKQILGGRGSQLDAMNALTTSIGLATEYLQAIYFEEATVNDKDQVVSLKTVSISVLTK